MQTKILERINAASQLLQAKDIQDILKASTLLQNAISVLVKFREQFDEAKSAALALATVTAQGCLCVSLPPLQ